MGKDKKNNPDDGMNDDCQNQSNVNVKLLIDYLCLQDIAFLPHTWLIISER